MLTFETFDIAQTTIQAAPDLLGYLDPGMGSMVFQVLLAGAAERLVLPEDLGATGPRGAAAQDQEMTDEPWPGGSLFPRSRRLRLHATRVTFAAR